MLDRSVLEAQGNHRVDAPRVPDWVAGWGLAVLLAALIAYAVTTGIWLLAYSRQVDLMIYRYAGQSVLHHTPLYDYGLSGKSGELLFTYPPFGAILFTPLALFPVTLLRVVVPIGNVVLLVLIVRRCWQVMGIRTGKELQPLTMLGAGALLWLTPVHTTIALGQIGLGLLAVLVFDLLPLDGRADGAAWGRSCCRHQAHAVVVHTLPSDHRPRAGGGSRDGDLLGHSRRGLPARAVAGEGVLARRGVP